MQVEYSYADAPTVKKFAGSDALVRGLMGPFGSGKSSGSVIETVRRGAAQAPGSDGIRRTRTAVVRNTYRELKDTTIKTFHDWFPPGRCGEWKESDLTYVVKTQDAEMEVLFRALDRPDDVKKLLSLELTNAWVNEAREIPWAVIQVLIGRLGRFPAQKDGGPTWYGLWMDTNPPDEDSWWFERFENIKPAGWELFKQPSGLSKGAENIKNLPPNYYQNLLGSMDAERAKVYVHGNYGFVIDGKPVYPEYNDSIHCAEIAAIKGLPIYRGWDFGLTPACIFLQQSVNGQVLVLDEVTADNMGIERFGVQAVAHSGKHWESYAFEDIGDPAGNAKAQTDERTCFEILKGMGISITAGDQDPNIRVECVKKALNTMVDGKPGLIVHPRCKTLRKGFMGGYQYRRMQVTAERYADKPEKNMYSHPHDALQYPMTRLFAYGLRGSKAKPAAIDYSKALPDSFFV